MKPLFIFSFFLISTANFAQTNLIKNGGFELETQNWNGDAATVSPYDKKAGKNSIVINQFTGAEWKAIDQTISIPKNTFAIECSVWMKTDGVENQKEEYKAGAVILEFTNAGGKQISTETIGRAKENTNWTNYKKAIKIPTDAKKIRVMLALAQTNGSVFFDEIKINPITEEDFSKLINDAKQ